MLTAEPVPSRPADERVFEGEVGQDLGPVGGAAIGQDLHDHEVGRGPDRRQHDHDREHFAHLRDRDVPELVPAVGAVDPGGLVHLLGDRLEPGEEAHRVERRARPHHDRDHRGHRDLRVAEPGDHLLDLEHRDQEVVQQPAEVVVDPAEAQRRDDRRHRPGHEQDGPPDVVERPVLAQHQRHAEPEQELDRDRREGVDDRVADHPQEHRVGEQLVIVGGADEARRRADHLVGEADPDRREERVDHDEGEHGQRRGQEQERDEPLVVQKLGPARRPGRLLTPRRADRLRLLSQHVAPCLARCCLLRPDLAGSVSRSGGRCKLRGAGPRVVGMMARAACEILRPAAAA